MAFGKSPLEGGQGGVVSMMHDFKCVLKRIAVRMMSLKPIFAIKNTPLTPPEGGNNDVFNLFKYALINCHLQEAFYSLGTNSSVYTRCGTLTNSPAASIKKIAAK